jgi:Xaa-Pro aminopeptidase
MRKLLVMLAVGISGISGIAQNMPGDFLTKDFHQERRQKLREKLPLNSVAVLFANAERNRANDVDYKYHQDPDFYYLTGYREANSVLLIFKDKQKNPNGTFYDEIIFVQPRNALSEMWTGRRLGDQGVKEQLGFALAFKNSEFKKYNLDFSKFTEILFFDFKNDVRNEKSDSSDLYDLIAQFKAKVNYPNKESLSVNPEPQKNNLNMKGLGQAMNQLRGIKTPDELKLLRKAIQISCQAQIEVMKAMKPGMSELEVQGIHEYVFKKYKSEDIGYGSIVGAGDNGCILHYEENYKPSIGKDELILMDLGAEYHGYTADITRTIPVSGTFSPEQKQIYELVLSAQEEAMKICKAGTPMKDLGKITHERVNRGLKELGIIKTDTSKNSYYPHGCCHHIGLDVHDRGTYDVLQENMTITIEPGIYIPENSKCDKRWWGIGVRIEDDVLVTKDGFELMSKLAPRTVKDIEDMMKQSSPFDAVSLPSLDK